MQLALSGLEQGEVPVGAVIVDRAGRVIAESANGVQSSRQAIEHAECIALRHAAQVAGYRDLRDFILVCNLEPCQMCTEACKLYRIGGVVFGAYNTSKVYAAPADWVGGVCEDDAHKIIRDAFREVR
jgi:tRNA(adenine34) deaminase